MLKYLQGLLLLRTVNYDLEGCQDVYFLQRVLNLFLQAEGKMLTWDRGERQMVASAPLGRPWVVSRLPQFSERIHDRIQEVRRVWNDAQLSQIRVPSKPSSLGLEPRSLEDLAVVSGSFLKDHHALLLTYTGFIPGLDHEEESE